VADLKRANTHPILCPFGFRTGGGDAAMAGAAQQKSREKPEIVPLRHVQSLTRIKNWHGGCEMACEPIRICPMRHIKSLALAALLSLTATAVQAQDWANSGVYNGYGAMNQNTASNFSLRDPQNNLTMVNGQITSGNIGANQGNQQASAGVGRPWRSAISCRSK